MLWSVGGDYSRRPFKEPHQPHPGLHGVTQPAIWWVPCCHLFSQATEPSGVNRPQAQWQNTKFGSVFKTPAFIFSPLPDKVLPLFCNRILALSISWPWSWMFSSRQEIYLQTGTESSHTGKFLYPVPAPQGIMAASLLRTFQSMSRRWKRTQLLYYR